jgi:hypothetical protein
MELAALLGNVAQFVGAVAVVATLLYLALQVRQAERTSRTQLNQAFASEINAVNRTIAADGSWAAIFAKVEASMDALTPEERVRYSFLELATCRSIEALYLHVLEGATAPEVFDVQRATLAALATAPGWREWWRTQPFPFTPQFRVLVDELVREAERAPADVGIATLYRARAEVGPA